MELTDFIDGLLKNVFTDTDVETVNGSTEYKELDEWSSLTAFSLITYIENSFGRRLMLPELLQAQTIEDLYKIVNS